MADDELQERPETDQAANEADAAGSPDGDGRTNAAGPPRVSVFGGSASAGAREPATGELPAIPPARAAQRDTAPLPLTKSGRPKRPGQVKAGGRHRRLTGLIVAAAVVVAAAGGYVGAAYYFADRVPKGAAVAGVDIGALTTDAAVARLRDELDEKSKQTVPVVIGDEEADFDPVLAGLGFSPQNTVAALTGLSFDPTRLWEQVKGIGQQELALVVDQAALETHLEELAALTRVEPVSGTVGVATGEVVITEPVTGLQLATAQALAQIQEDYLVKDGPWQLPTEALAPAIGPEEVERAVAAIADPLLSGPVTVAVGEASVEIPASEVAAAAVIQPAADDAGTLALGWDKELLGASVSKRLPAGIEVAAADARFVFVDGQPVIEDGVKGAKIDPDGLAAAMAAAAVASGAERRAVVELTEADPAAGRAELEQLGVKEVVGRFETQATNSVDRTKNLRKAAEIVTGMLVKPGETFSLDKALGHRSLETGWFNAGVVVAGVNQDGIGGGLSQFSTTLYNAAHLAGMVDVEHTPHANYFSRYPTGREATIWEGQIDNQFKNDTPYGVVLRAGVSDSLKVWVELWSTKYWTVEAEIGEPYSYTAPRTIESTKSDCKPQSGGISGFQVDYWRVKTDPEGNAQDRETWHWRYDPMNAIVCKNPDADATP
ncbi:MAG: VanW family protein [Bifidobacteriaceae bacterium]|nr:VanW family protein [Bifidobacteriaceae bacterium]